MPRLRAYLVLPPELVDGQATEICPVYGSRVTERIREWLEEADDGDEIVIGCSVLTDQEFDDLPDL